MLDLVNLRPLMQRTSGRREIGIGLVDGPVAIAHPDLADARIVPVGAEAPGCRVNGGEACAHGTFVAGILVARRGSAAPAICPDCTLLVRPVFAELAPHGSLPAASADEVAHAIFECVGAGARIVNLSAATAAPTTASERELRLALDHAARSGAIVVAAAGNQGALGSSEITRHPGVVPVVAYDGAGRPAGHSNLGGSLGRRGLGAPGEHIVSLAPDGGAAAPASGTSFAAAIVSGALALLWSLQPDADASALRHALAPGVRRGSVVPPLLDADAALAALGGRVAA
jgi:subtilisin family serine protease